MKIGIIGSGSIGSTIGKLWSQAGHEVLFSSRNPEKLSGLVAEAGSSTTSGTVQDAVAFADILFLATNYWTLDEALQNMGDVSGKTILDATNPYQYNDAGKVVRAIPNDISGGTLLQEKLPDSKIIKVFSSMMATIMAEKHHKQPLLVIPYTTDYEELKKIAEQLITDAGFLPIYYGKLKYSKPIELFGKYSDKVMDEKEATQLFEADFKERK
ncbi:NAD(P)-binding domain-containing protein [Aquimarina sp. U1-2]|uniref:NADPH-dependent F420 reductase n=1 Tax=Aquimarina sp. U1-2 TaxID=2823141 RepID=UPI001AED0036|nr:NAD(P)-binding domain-containing protein [Aquimarina sp. U1-2]MBP2831850.1 NAD(P)-binding domain-containing protein [Aquimarina sp. U1-2]